ncbi:MAG: flagellar hook-associated protein FlgL [Gammaproteobacteria bacterium]
MRIATSHLFQSTSLAITQQQGGIAKVQEQIASGKRLLRPSDDPAGATRVLDLTQGIERVEQFSKNAAAAEQRLVIEDTVLASVTNLLQRVRELALAANSGTQSAEERAAYRGEVEQQLDQLLDDANSQDGNGDHLFSGFKGRTPPFIASGAQVLYNGDQGQQMVQVGAVRQVATGDPGTEVFQRIPNGNGTFVVSSLSGNTGSGIITAGSVIDPNSYLPHDFTLRFTSDITFDVINDTTGTTVASSQSYMPGNSISFNGIETSISGVPRNGDEFRSGPSQNQDMFATLRNFINAMAIDPVDAPTRAQLTQTMNGVITDLGNSLGHVLEVRTAVGARLNSLDALREENEALKIQLQKARSEVQDLDYAEAVSRLQLQMTTLQGTLQSFAQIEQLSLFNLLR